MSQKLLYRITFVQQGQLYEVYAERVSQGELFGFVEIEGLVFGERSRVVVDPTEERVKSEFRDVARFHLPLQSIVRIDEVRKAGVSRISSAEPGQATVSLFPGATSVSRPGDGESES